VNNVGYNLDYPEYFLDANLQQQMDIIEVNVKATTRITYTILPLLLKRKGSLVINIASIAGMLPAPLLSVYSASKSYVATWSKCLHAEYKSRGCSVICLVPAFVVSNMSKRSRSSLTVPSADKYANHALSNITGDWVHTGYWPHQIMLVAGSLVPESMFIWKNKSMHEDIKKAALRKRERLAKAQ